MERTQRRKFLGVAAAGAAGAAAWTAFGPLPAKVRSNGDAAVLRFRAVAPLPQEPLPAYASYLVEGRVDVKGHSGVFTSKLVAGAPEAMSAITFPGTVRRYRVTDVQQLGKTLRITGEVDRSTKLGNGEGREVEIVVDQDQGTVAAK